MLEQAVEDGELSEFVTMLWDVTEEERNGHISLPKYSTNLSTSSGNLMKPQAPVSRRELENTVKDSWGLLDAFVPEE